MHTKIVADIALHTVAFFLPPCIASCAYVSCQSQDKLRFSFFFFCFLFFAFIDVRIIKFISVSSFFSFAQKMNSIIYLSLFALLACSVYGRAIDEPDNTISSDTTFVEINEWVKVKPIKIRPHVGNTVELECDVIGSPPPSIHWRTGGDKSVDNVSISLTLQTFISVSFNCFLASVLLALLLCYGYFHKQ